MNQRQKRNHKLKNKEKESPHQKGTNPTEKDAAAKSQRAAAEDTTATAEAPAIETNNVGIRTQTTKETAGGVDMNTTVAEEHIHQNMGEETIEKNMNQGLDHQITQDIKSIRKTTTNTEGETETRQDDHTRIDEGNTHLMKTKDMKTAKARVALEKLSRKKHLQEIETEASIIRTMNRIETVSEMITVSRTNMATP